MGRHRAPKSGWRAAGNWLVANRVKVLATLVTSLPLVVRLIPGFPANAVLDVARILLGT